MEIPHTRVRTVNKLYPIKATLSIGSKITEVRGEVIKWNRKFPEQNFGMLGIPREVVLTFRKIPFHSAIPTQVKFIRRVISVTKKTCDCNGFVFKLVAINRKISFHSPANYVFEVSNRNV